MALLPNAQQKWWSGIVFSGVALTMLIGCGKFQSGGGARSIVAGGTTTEAVYGFGQGKKLEFVLLTDISSEGATASAGSTWTGRITPRKGPTVEYQGSARGINVNGSQYDFTNGRVFLVSTKENTISIRQLNSPMKDADYKTEIDRIVKTEEVQTFLGVSKRPAS